MTATRAPGRSSPSRQATDARIVAADICADLRTGEFLDPAFERRTAPLDVRDRRWTRELVYGMLISYLRHIPVAVDSMRAGEWRRSTCRGDIKNQASNAPAGGVEGADRMRRVEHVPVGMDELAEPANGNRKE